MIQRYLFLLLRSFGIIIASVGFLSGFFIVDQIEQVLITEFGKLKRTIKTPGLYWRIPIIESVTRYEKRLLNCDISEIELTIGDQKRILIDVFSRYVIGNPEVFYKTVRNEDGALQRLNVIISGDLRNILGKYSLQEILSEKREEIEYKLEEKVKESTRFMGIDMIEIKIRGILFPEKNRQAVFERMRSERLCEAQEWRGKAMKISSEIKSNADIVAAKTIANANQAKEIIIGSAKADALKIRESAYSESTEFAELFIMLESYSKSFDNKNTSLFINSKHLYLKYLA